MKKFIIPIVAIALLSLTVSGCGKKNAPEYKKKQEQGQSLQKITVS